MNNLWRVFRITFADVIRSKWNIGFFLFFLGVTFTLLYFSSNLSKGLVSILNIILFIVPLMGSIMGSMYYYNSIDFIDLLLSQPLKRSSVFLGQSLGLAMAIAISFALGLGVPFLSYGLFQSNEIWNFVVILLSGFSLSIIFTSIAYMISIYNPDKVRGIGISLMVWLFMAIIYDGLFLLYLMIFQDYPVERHALAITMINPIDLARVTTMLKLDIAALLGYTGAVFKNFFGSGSGFILSGVAMTVWAIIPFLFIIKKGNRKDF